MKVEDLPMSHIRYRDARKENRGEVALSLYLRKHGVSTKYIRSC